MIETNLFGQVNGARAALRRFREQDDGTLINVASVWARLTTPQVSPYVTSKFALRAFAECLRQELAGSPNIRIATILPQAVDTPIFGHAANFTGRFVRPIPPLLDPQDVARAIVRCARTPAREVTIGRLGRLLELLHCAAPGLHDRTVAHGFEAGSFGRAPAARTTGNVLEPVTGCNPVDGGWRHTHAATFYGPSQRRRSRRCAVCCPARRAAVGAETRPPRDSNAPAAQKTALHMGGGPRPRRSGQTSPLPAVSAAQALRQHRVEHDTGFPPMRRLLEQPVAHHAVASHRAVRSCPGRSAAPATRTAPSPDHAPVRSLCGGSTAPIDSASRCAPRSLAACSGVGNAERGAMFVGL